LRIGTGRVERITPIFAPVRAIDMSPQPVYAIDKMLFPTANFSAIMSNQKLLIFIEFIFMGVTGSGI